MPYPVLCAAVILLSLIFPFSEAEGFQLSGGVDLRYRNTDGKENDVTLDGVFINLRKVFSDEKGDRLIAVGQLDMEHNLEKIRPYQTYLQYKGALGRWNIKGGHYTLPFGLLAGYDTERLVLQTLEHLSLGIKLDTGVELSGYRENFDYALSISEGVGRNRLTDVDEDKLVTARFAWQGDDINAGLSVLFGRVLPEEDSEIYKEAIYEKRLGTDITWYTGPIVLRGEFIIGEDGGEDNDQTVGGGILRADYAVTPQLELNLKYARWQKKEGRDFIGAGFSYELYKGLFIRVADEYQFGKEDENAATFQVYYEFSRQP